MLAPLAGQRAYLFGQAPGIQEGLERRPWRGRAGQTLRRWLELDEDEFYATFHCASVTRCYPGPRRLGARRPHADARGAAALRVLARARAGAIRPRLIVTVGGLAARTLLGLKSVTEAVGTRIELDGRRGRDPAPAPLGREQLAQPAREPGARRGGRGARPRRASPLPPRCVV